MKITIHIGLPKTATTIIQQRLASSSAALLNSGINYLSAYRDAEGIAHHQLPVILRNTNQDSIHGIIAELTSIIRHSAVDNIVLSSEDFSNSLAPPCFEAFNLFLHLLKASFDVTLVLCLRRFDAQFESMYLHSTKMGQHSLSIIDYLDKRHSWIKNFFQKISILRQEHGKDVIKILKFERTPNYFESLYDALGIDEALLSPPNKSNSRSNAKLTLKQQTVLYRLPQVVEAIGCTIDRQRLVRAFEKGDVRFASDVSKYTVTPFPWRLYYQQTALHWALYYKVQEYYDAFEDVKDSNYKADELCVTSLTTADYCRLFSWATNTGPTD